MAKTKAVTKKGKHEVMAKDFETDSGMGFEKADKDAYAIPFLTVLQDLSPQVKKKNAAYVDGAEPGMIYNSVTEKVYNGEEGILIVPVSYHRNYIEWVPRSAGGGFVAAHDIEPEGAEWINDEAGVRCMLPTGNELADTRNHYIVLVDELEPALICMTKTQIKKSRKWMSQMQALKFKGSNGKLFTPPMFASVFKATIVLERKDQNEWYGWKFERVRDVEQAEYGVAKGFLDAVKEEKAVTDYSNLDRNVNEEAASSKATKKTDDMPF